MKTRSVGEILKAERERHHLAIIELAKLTRIKVEFLTALENNEFTQLPAAIFVKGYIKTYGEVLGFDAKPMVAMLRRDFKESVTGNLVPREFIKPTLKRSLLWTPVRMVVVLLVTLFAVLFGYTGWQWYNLNRPPRLDIFSPKDDEYVAARVSVKGKTIPDAVVAINAQPIDIQVDGSFETTITLPKEGVYTITIDAIDRRNKTSTVQRTVYVRF